MWNETLPRYTAVGCAACAGPLGQAAEDQYKTMTAGHVALAAAGGILLGMAMTYAWMVGKVKG